MLSETPVEWQMRSVNSGEDNKNNLLTPTKGIIHILGIFWQLFLSSSILQVAGSINSSVPQKVSWSTTVRVRKDRACRISPFQSNQQFDSGSTEEPRPTSTR